MRLAIRNTRRDEGAKGAAPTVCGSLVTAFFSLLVLSMAPPAGAAPGQLPGDLGAALRMADDAHVRYDVAAERRILEHAAGLAGEGSWHALVQRRLAVLEWKYFGEVDAARARLRAATGASEPASAWLALARLELVGERPDAALLAADQALLAADTADLRAAASLAIFRARVAAGAAARVAGQEPPAGALRQTVEGLRAMVEAEPGELESSQLLVGAALLVDDGASALLGWRSYYHAFPGLPLPNSVDAAGATLQQILAATPDLAALGNDPPGARRLIDALVGTRFLREASWLARDPRLAGALASDAEIRALLAYVRALRRLRPRVEDYYRRMILGNYEPEDLTRAVLEAGREVWAELPGLGPAPDDPMALWAPLEERFGAALRLSRTNRRYDLVLGHVVIDEERTVEQYGRTARVRFVALDHMVSRGFRDWAWEHRQGARGFASASTITQIRPAYVPEALWAWRAVTDPRTRSAHERRIARETEIDERRAAADPHAYLPGLGMRLAHQGRVQPLLEQIRAVGLEGEALRAAYLHGYQEALRQSSIFAHEGRHAMDLREFLPYHRELAARLSEVAFADHPRLAFSGIIDSNIGDRTFHGSANLLFMEGLVGWLGSHRDEVDGLDPSRPLLPQLDLLTDEQLRRACRDLDPYLAARDG